MESKAVNAAAMANFDTLLLIAGYAVIILILAFGATIIIKIWRGTIKIDFLINERDGQASLSRFQFLIFTFVIAISLFVLVIANIKSGDIVFPTIGSGVWALLGISGGSYVLSKGIHKPGEGNGDKAKEPKAAPDNPKPGNSPA